MSEEVEESIGECVCSLCGATVIPEAHDTNRGVRYRCPECKKFMRPLPLEDVEEVPLEVSETPKEVARRMLIEGKHTIEEIMAETDLSQHVVGGLKGTLAKKGELPSQRKKEGEKEKEPLLPDDVAMTNRVKEMLAEDLPTVYGLPQKQKGATIIAILDTITKSVVRDPLVLHSHIKWFAKSVNDKHLEAVIAKIYSRLSDEGYLSREDGYRPMYSGIRRERREGAPGRYSGLRRELGIREDEIDEYDRKRGQRMTVVVQGQAMETDLEGFMAWQSWKKESSAEERHKEEHQLRMKKLEAEITKIHKATGGEANLVEVPIGDGKTIKVPASIAPLYLRGDDSLKRELDKEREKRHEAEQKGLSDQIQRLSENINKQPSFLEQLDFYKQAGLGLGMKTTGRTTLDILSEGMDKVDNRAAQLLQRMPGPSSEFTPQVTRTPDERKDKAKEIMSGLDTTEDIVSAENAFLEAASRINDSE